MVDEIIEVDEGKFRELLWNHTITNPNPAAIERLLGDGYKLITNAAGCENGFRRMIQSELINKINENINR